MNEEFDRLESATIERCMPHLKQRENRDAGIDTYVAGMMIPLLRERSCSLQGKHGPSVRVQVEDILEDVFQLRRQGLISPKDSEDILQPIQSFFMEDVRVQLRCAGEAV